MERKITKLLLIGLLKFGALATLRGRLPTKDDVKKKRRREKKGKKNVEKERLSNEHLWYKNVPSAEKERKENKNNSVLYLKRMYLFCNYWN